MFILSPLLYLICLLTAGLEDLTWCPTDQQLYRLVDLLPVDTFKKFVIRLGLSENLRGTILEKYQRYSPKVMNFMALCEWRKEKYKNVNAKTISFNDFSEALAEVHHNKHVLCQVGNN
jgi:hypothetical protein